MIDWQRVCELRDEIGAEDFADVVELFLDEVETNIAPLRGDPETSGLEALLHFLKGSALNLGFSSFSDLCQAGETSASRGQYDLIDLSAIVASYDTSRHEFLARLAAPPRC